MGKKICRHGRTPAYGLPNRILKSTDFSVDGSGQSVLLNDQANVIFTGLREPMLQYQTVHPGDSIPAVSAALMDAAPN
jgi:hypothetical protein